MQSKLTCRPEREFPVALLRVAGSLDIVTAPALRRAVHRCLADQPDGVVVDLADLEVDEPLALAVFAAVTRQAADWPAVPIVLCCPGRATAARLDRSPVRRSVLVAATEAEALAHARVPADPPRVRTTLQPVVDACRQAREAVGNACTRWKMPHLAGSASVIASELVANVVRYAQTPMQLTIAARDRRLSLAVRDGSTALPRPASPAPGVAGGRGLLLVRELADRWGTLSLPGGKVVWATVAAS